MNKNSSTDSNFNIKASGDHIWFYGEVDENSAISLNVALHDLSMKISPTAFSSMQEVNQPAPIYLHINSVGGELFSAFAIADTIDRISAIVPIVTIIEGCAASAATIISTAAPTRYIRKNALVLIHELRGVTWGKYSDIKEATKNYDGMMRQMKKWYVNRTKISESELTEILKKDVWWNSKQCIKYGIVHQII